MNDIEKNYKIVGFFPFLSNYLPGHLISKKVSEKYLNEIRHLLILNHMVEGILNE